MHNTSFVPSACMNVLYTPAFLLDAGFDASITDHHDFAFACRDGFRGFFRDMSEEDASGNIVFVGCSLAYCEVEREIVLTVARQYDSSERFYEQQYGSFLSLSWRAGYMLGWLSALASVNAPLAFQGLHLLSLLVPSCQREETRGIAC